MAPIFRSAVTWLLALVMPFQVLTDFLNRRHNDIDYFYESRLAGEAGPVADIHFHPVEKRALRLSLTASY